MVAAVLAVSSMAVSAQTRTDVVVSGVVARGWSLHDNSTITLGSTDAYHELDSRLDNPTASLKQSLRTPAALPFVSALSDQNAGANGSIASMVGPFELHAVLAYDGGYWSSASTQTLTHLDFLLPPQSAVTVSGHVQASFDAPFGNGSFVFGTHLNAFTDDDFFTVHMFGAGSESVEQDFSITAKNTTDSTIRMTWSTDGAAVVSLQAIPEPGQWAMLLAGLGVLLPLARRRRPGYHAFHRR
jgi:hypothetical protein